MKTQKGEKIMFCPNCGTQLEENTAYCPSCGAAAGSYNAAQPEQASFPAPTVLPTPEQGRIDPKQLPPSPQQDQNIDLNSVVSNISKREPEPYTSANGYTDEDMAWFTDHQLSSPPLPIVPPKPPTAAPASANPSVFAQIPVPVDLTPRKSNVLLGLIGALVFSLIGCVIWVVIGSFGYISYLGALAMSFLTVTGYKLLGRKFDLRGIFVCLIIVALAVLVSNIFINALAIATDEELMEIMGYLGYNSFSDVFLHFFDMVKDVDLILETFAPGEGTMMEQLVRDLAFSYLFAGIAFIVVAIPQYKASKNL